jgi:DNA polymerase-4
MSEEAEASGVHAGQKASAARSLCPDLQTLLYDADAYEEMAVRLWNLYAEESSIVEPASPEMSYLVFDGSVEISGAALKLAEGARNLFGGRICVGIGGSKLTARLAAQSNGMAILSSRQESAFLSAVPIDSLSLDNRTLEWLRGIGVKTLGDTKTIPAKYISRRNKETLLQLQQILRGNDGDIVRPLWPSRVLPARLHFEEPTEQMGQIEGGIRSIAKEIAGALQSDYKYCRAVSLRVLGTNNSRYEMSEILISPSNSAQLIERAGLRLFHRLNVKHFVETIILEAAKIDAGSGLQQRLFDETGADFPEQRQRALSGMIAGAQKKWGQKSLTTGSSLAKIRQISLCAYPLGHRCVNAPIEVVVNDEGQPAHLRIDMHARRQVTKSYSVINIQARWREKEWFPNNLEYRVYRVQTIPEGFFEICNSGDQWHLRAIAD